VLESSEAMAFVPSEDLDRAEAFFHGILGLEVLSQSPYATVFRVGGATLRVIKVDELRPQSFTVFGWLVDDIRGVIGQLRNRGTETLRYDGFDQDDDGIWTTGNGDQIAWFHDPDANVLSLTQLADG